MSEFMLWFKMHGYAMYIWSAYGLVLGVLAMNLITIRWRGKRTRDTLRKWLNHAGAAEVRRQSEVGR